MNDNLFFIYGRPNCPFCEAAKLLLNLKNQRFVYIDLIEMPKARDPEWHTVPQIFEGGEYIGGFEELELWISEQGL